MSLWGLITGSDAASASKNAAADTYAKQQQAVQGVTGYGDTYKDAYSGLASNYSPYMQTGYTANNQLNNLISDPSSVSSLPGYQFALNEGIKGLDRSASARGMLNSGAAGKDVLKYATGYADQTYGNQLQRLMGVGSYGQNATSGYNSAAGQGLQGQLQTQMAGYQGNMNSAGTIGQGQVAGAQAQQSAFNNLLGVAASLGGSYLGGGNSSALKNLFSNGGGYSQNYNGSNGIYGPGF